jgi:hypothetical protein
MAIMLLAEQRELTRSMHDDSAFARELGWPHSDDPSGWIGLIELALRRVRD